MNTKFGIVLATALLWGAGCATSDEDAAGTGTADEDAIAVSSVQLASEDQIQALGLEGIDAPGADPGVLFGCSNRQIRIFQAACSQVICGTRGSNGIHFCDQRPPNVVAQCDCRSGADPLVTCSLADCPQ